MAHNSLLCIWPVYTFIRLVCFSKPWPHAFTTRRVMSWLALCMARLVFSESELEKCKRTARERLLTQPKVILMMLGSLHCLSSLHLQSYLFRQPVAKTVPDPRETRSAICMSGELADRQANSAPEPALLSSTTRRRNARTLMLWTPGLDDGSDTRRVWRN